MSGCGSLVLVPLGRRPSYPVPQLGPQAIETYEDLNRVKTADCSLCVELPPAYTVYLKRAEVPTSSPAGELSLSARCQLLRPRVNSV